MATPALSHRPGLTTAALLRSRAAMLGIGITSIWFSTVLTSFLAPDMVTGSQHEHLPIVGFTMWMWATLASGLLALAEAQDRESTTAGGRWTGAIIAVSAVWIAAMLIALFSPVFVTGTDPTRIPLAAILAPVGAVLTTAYLAVYAAGSRPSGST